MPYLIVNADNYKFKIYHFITNIRIGRHPRSDIILNSVENKTISRHHVNIQFDEKGYLLIDSSLNGTRINNELIKSHRLSNGDRFQIADYLFTFIDESIVKPEDNRQDIHNPQSSGGEQKTIRIIGSGIDNEAFDSTLKEMLKATGTIAEDEQMLALYRDIHKFAVINVPILILGEPGTGKEKVAQAIHYLSQASGDFVAVNCSAIPESLFESELFGSIKGAFSDASTKAGKLELANNGTLFLDEIGDMVLSCQPKLLRFLESRSMSRLGETRIRKLNIRIVAATNQDLNAMIQTKGFRADLFQRLSCIKINIPPLCERKKDILALANYFIADYVRQYGFTPLTISKQASKMMLSYRWPGNVRELANMMLNAILRASGPQIKPDDLIMASEKIGDYDIGVDTDFLSLKEIEKIHIHKVLKRTNNNKTKACEVLGISRDTLYKKIQKYNIG